MLNSLTVANNSNLTIFRDAYFKRDTTLNNKSSLTLYNNYITDNISGAEENLDNMLVFANNLPIKVTTANESNNPINRLIVKEGC